MDILNFSTLFSLYSVDMTSSNTTNFVILECVEIYLHNYPPPGRSFVLHAPLCYEFIYFYFYILLVWLNNESRNMFTSTEHCGIHDPSQHISLKLQADHLCN